MQRPPKNWIKQSTCYRRYAELELLSNSITWPACLVQTMNVLILFSPPLSLSLSYLGRKTNIKGYDQTFTGKTKQKKTSQAIQTSCRCGIPFYNFPIRKFKPTSEIKPLVARITKQKWIVLFWRHWAFLKKDTQHFSKWPLWMTQPHSTISWEKLNIGSRDLLLTTFAPEMTNLQ